MVTPTLSYTEARQNLAKTIQTCVDDCQPVIIRSRERAVAMIPLAEYEALAETEYLLRSSANVSHLGASLKSVQKGKLKEISLKDLKSGTVTR